MFVTGMDKIAFFWKESEMYMVEDALVKAQELLKVDCGSPDAEWQKIEHLLNGNPDERNRLLEWLFRSYKGYTGTRARAGCEVMSTHPSTAWTILEMLIHSADPDDRDTALTVLIESTETRSQLLAKKILDDPYPYLRLEAAEYLKSVFPTEVAQSLQVLLTHEQQWIRAEATTLMSELDNHD